MKTYEQLEKEFKAKVAWLQKRCPHTDISGWTFRGRVYEGEVKVCKSCGKVMEKKTYVFGGTFTSASNNWEEFFGEDSNPMVKLERP